MKKNEIKFEMSKFEFNYTIEIKDSLKKLGINRAFDDNLADFRGIKEYNDLIIDKVIHEIFLKVEEIGTEAYERTSMTGRKKIYKPKKYDYYEMIVNIPFIFSIINSKFIRNKFDKKIMFTTKIEYFN